MCVSYVAGARKLNVHLIQSNPDVGRELVRDAIRPWTALADKSLEELQPRLRRTLFERARAVFGRFPGLARLVETIVGDVLQNLAAETRTALAYELRKEAAQITLVRSLPFSVLER